MGTPRITCAEERARSTHHALSWCCGHRFLCFSIPFRAILDAATTTATATTTTTTTTTHDPPPLLPRTTHAPRLSARPRRLPPHELLSEDTHARTHGRTQPPVHQPAHHHHHPAGHPPRKAKRRFSLTHARPRDRLSHPTTSWSESHWKTQYPRSLCAGQPTRPPTRPPANTPVHQHAQPPSRTINGRISVCIHMPTYGGIHTHT